MAYTGQPAFVNDYYQNLLQQAYNTGMQPMQASPVPGVAGINDWQKQGLDLAAAGVGAWMPYYDQAQNELSRSAGYLQAGTEGAAWDPNKTQQHLNTFLPNVLDEIARRGNENFADVTTQNINSNFGMANQFGSARHEDAMAHAAALNQREISGAQANAMNTGYDNAARDYLGWGQLEGQYNINAAGAANTNAGGWQNLGAQAQQRNTNDIGNLNTAGGIVGGNEQANLNWANQQFNQQQMWPWQQIQNMSAALGNGLQFSTNTSTNTPSLTMGANPYGGLTQFAATM